MRTAQCAGVNREWGRSRPDQSNLHDEDGCSWWDPKLCCPPYGDCDHQWPLEINSGPIAIYGGFPPDPHEWNDNAGAHFGDRDPSIYPTVVTGDLGRNDQFTGGLDPSGNLDLQPVGYEENSDRLLIVRGVAKLDGLIFEGARVEAIRTEFGGSLEMRDCTVRRNYRTGIAIASQAASFWMWDSTVIHNGFDTFSGGGVRVSFGHAFILRSTITQNRANVQGGGISSDRAGSFVLVNTNLTHNEAPRGGGVYVTYITVSGVTLRFWNVLIARNKAIAPGWEGAGLYISGGQNNEVEIINCTIAHNDAGSDSSSKGGGVYVSTLHDFRIQNSILWGNTATADPQLQVPTWVPATVDFSNIEGGWTGSGSNNLNVDPQFEDAANGDYRLKSTSPCIDRASACLLPLDCFDIDPEVDGWDGSQCTHQPGCPAGISPPTDRHPIDLQRHERVLFGGHSCDPDMGAFEYEAQCGDCPADLTDNCNVGVPDLLALLSAWGECSDCNDCPADLTGNCNVGVPDLLALLAAWGPCPGPSCPESAREISEEDVEKCFETYSHDLELLIDCIESLVE